MEWGDVKKWPCWQWILEFLFDCSFLGAQSFFLSSYRPYICKIICSPILSSNMLKKWVCCLCCIFLIQWKTQQKHKLTNGTIFTHQKHMCAFILSCTAAACGNFENGTLLHCVVPRVHFLSMPFMHSIIHSYSALKVKKKTEKTKPFEIFINTKANDIFVPSQSVQTA